MDIFNNFPSDDDYDDYNDYDDNQGDDNDDDDNKPVDNKPVDVEPEPVQAETVTPAMVFDEPETIDAEKAVELANVFSRGVLVKVSIPTWGAKIKLPSEKLAQTDADKDFIKAQKELIDRTHLNPIVILSTQTRAHLKKNSFDFPIRGVYFVPMVSVAGIKDYLKEQKAKFQTEVALFCANYSAFIAEAKNRLNGLFNELDYPGTDEIASKFSFSWSFISVSEPDAKYFDEETYQEQKQQWLQDLATFRDSAIIAMREKFKESVALIASNLSDPSKRFKVNCLANFQDFLDSFEKLNISDDTELKNLIEQAKEYTGGLTPDQIANRAREDSIFRGEVAEKFTTGLGAITEMMEKMPGRKLRKADNSDD